MILQFQGSGGRKTSRHSVLQQAICLGTLFLFGFSICRFYLVAPSECLEHPQAHEANAPSAHTHTHLGQPRSQENDTGFYFQHCKDSYDSMGWSPMQPMGVPTPVSSVQPAASQTTLEPQGLRLPESFPPPFFHPPRHLG
ncbi:MAG: hypothetical protein A3G20_02585 [Acidobacteria bacterium RIFCSPLOWO2_12_FULL_59_11]|nr:MAG: hypothetical protein A3G20_02585 [Acidobacteria bacterium RIFCSPLOWO2_12_FULL_59_11]